MSEQTFPYTGWVLMPSFKPAQVSIVEKISYSFGSTYLRADSGKQYQFFDVHPSKQAAIEAGRASLDGQQSALDKKQANIIKRRAALDKAEASHEQM